MIATLKIPLYPTAEQSSLFHKMANAYHNLQNSAVEFVRDTEGWISEKDIRDYLSQFIFDDLPVSFINTVIAKEKHRTFKTHGRNRLRFHRYSESRKAFPVRCDANGYRLSRVYSDDGEYIKIPSINGVVKMSRLWVNKMKKQFGDSFCEYLSCKKQTARVTYDGKYWYLLFSYNVEVPEVELQDKAIGIDVGIKSLVVTSDGEFISGVNNTSQEVARLEEKLKRLQRIVSNKYRQNKSYRKSTNILRLEHKVYLLHRRLKNIRENELHHVSKMLVDKRYSTICFEDLNIRGMLKNRHLAPKISRQCWYKLMQFTEYKAIFFGEQFKRIGRYKPSSKLCSSCENIKHDLLLSDRVYICKNCGLRIDRDLNAALNIRNFGTC